MELKWDDTPATGPIPFSKDVFDKFTLTPTIKELWAILQSPDLKDEVKEESKTRAAGPSSEPSSTKSNINTAQTSTRNSHGSASDCSDTLDDKNNLAENKEDKGFPDPKIPYPCFSALTYKEQLTYLQSLRTKKYHTAPQNLIKKVRNEILEFMKYLQEVSRICADDYKYVPVGATRYLEEYFKTCLEYMKIYPPVYSIQEITSLNGGKFVSDISLNFEKQLLAMGHVTMVEKWMLQEKKQLSVDYDVISAVMPPFKKASKFHTAISTDSNAEKLGATYEPHVCLAKEAFIQLLNNSAEYMESWELPVWVKENSGKGCSQSKIVYIDPPLLQSQMTWRERNHLFLEESVKLEYRMTGSNPVFFLTSEVYSNKTDFAPEEKSSRAVVSFDDHSIDFEMDVTELESFGESYQPNKKVKGHDETQKLGLSKPKSDSEELALTEVVSTPKEITHLPLPTLAKEEMKEEVAKSDIEDSSMERSTEDILDSSSKGPVSNTSAMKECSSSECPPVKRLRYGSNRSTDSDEERLIIDHPSTLLNSTAIGSQVAPPAPENLSDISISSSNKQSTDPTTPSSPISFAKGAKKGAKRSTVSGDCDQLGQILLMQNAMLKSTMGKGQEPPKAQTFVECRSPETKVNRNPHTLVKPCVSSYLQSKEGLDEEVPHPAICQPKTQKKRLLREELLLRAEDEQDYKAPEEASVLYKLYSLLDVLLMVRSTVDIAHPRHDLGSFRAVPVHVLPKLEYQLCYGAEGLTHAEACQLWAEQLLHSSTVSFIGRINAQTSNIVQLQELQPDWIQRTSCDFNPVRCLNSLHHILKKVISLQEGRYLLGHKPGEAFVTIFKANDGKKPSRGIYDLQAVHCGPPVVPLESKVPWVPLDPLHLMPFHQKYKRPPCTFPPPSPSQHMPGVGKKAKQGQGITRPMQRSQQPSAALPNKNRKKKKSTAFWQKRKKKQKVVGDEI